MRPKVKPRSAPAVPRKPAWLKIRPPGGENFVHIKDVLRQRTLHTVCEEARCPNLSECWSGGTATFMLLGDVCTRACRFCAVMSGNPKGRLDADEPRKVAEAVAEMKLRYVVLTSVNRDDLEDQGAPHFAETVRRIHEADPSILVEVLIPDFRGDERAIDHLIAARPEVIAHNVETVRRLTPKVRDYRANFDQSLAVLEHVKRANAGLFTKTSIMLGLGETHEELVAAMEELRAHDVDILTLGQYLQPTWQHLPVERFVPPEEFEELREQGESRGFRFVASGPLVRSSYRAGELFVENLIRTERAANELGSTG